MITPRPIGLNSKESTMREGDIAGTIVERLEQVMLEAGVRQNQIRKEMAKIAGITVQAIAQWFDGRTKDPNIKHVASICAFYNADMMWVATGHPNARMYASVLKKRIARKTAQESTTGTTSRKKKGSSEVTKTEPARKRHLHAVRP